MLYPSLLSKKAATRNHITNSIFFNRSMFLIQYQQHFSTIKSKKGLPNSSLPLGHPIPLDEHACSVSLPTWSSVVGYEEGSPQIASKLACGYPRFVYHPYIIKLMNVSLEMDRKKHELRNNDNNEWDCIVLPTRDSALRCHDFLVKACGYYDGRAISPRLVDSKSVLHHIVGDARIQLFSSDNAFGIDHDQIESSSFDCYNPKAPIRVLDLNVPAGVHAVIFPAQTMFAIEAKSYWQHTGEVLSSRRAEVALSQVYNLYNNDVDGDEDSLPRVTSSFHCDNDDNIIYNDNEYNNNDDNCKLKHEWKKCSQTNQYHLALYPSDCEQIESDSNDDSNQQNPYNGIKDRIANIVGTPSSHVFLTPSGMASIYAALRAARRRKMFLQEEAGGGTSVVFGFPYLDTLKMCSRPELVPDGVEFFGHGNAQDLANLEQLLKERKGSDKPDVSVLITEFPSNPLLNCPDLHKLRSLADEYDFAVVVDDTIGNFANIDLIQSGLADVVCTSLTKLFNGRGDAMAGSVITNPNTKIGHWLQQDLEDNHHDHEGLWRGDAHAVNCNSVDFLSRSSQINEITEALADWLRERDEVSAIYYPKFTCPTTYNSCLNKSDYKGQHKAGYGGLFSIILQPHVCQRTFYDKLDLSKGPSLGTDFSLICPYTLLAHYHELDFAMSYDVQPNLLRFAIGLEDLETLKSRFTAAFQESKLHPKLPPKPLESNTGVRGFCTFPNIQPNRNIWSTIGNRRVLGNSLLSHANGALFRQFNDQRRLISSSSYNNISNHIESYNLRMLGVKALRQNTSSLSRIISLIR